MLIASRGGRSEEGGEEILDGLEKREMSSFLTISLSLVTSRGRKEPSYENLRKARDCRNTNILSDRWLRTRQQNIAQAANN